MSVVDCSCQCVRAFYLRSSKELAQSDKKSSFETYVVASLRLPELDVLGSKSHNIAMVIDNTSSCAACANVDSDVVVGVRPELVVRIGGELTARLIRVLSVRKIGHVGCVAQRVNSKILVCGQ